MQSKTLRWLVLLLFAVPAAAGILTTAAVGSFTAPVNVVPCAAQSNQGTDSAAANCFFVFDADFMLQADAQARASHGSLGVLTYARMTAIEVLPGVQIQVSADANAVFFDVFTINSPGRLSGSIQYIFAVEGGRDDDPASLFMSNTGAFRISQGAGGFPGQQWTTGLVNGSNLITSPPFDIRFGSPFVAQFSLNAGTLLRALPPGGSGDAGISFLNTATLVGFGVYDDRGGPITDYTVSASSGTQYPLTVDATPEPSTLILVGMALIVGSAVNIRRSRQLTAGQVARRAISPAPANTREISVRASS